MAEEASTTLIPRTSNSTQKHSRQLTAGRQRALRPPTTGIGRINAGGRRRDSAAIYESRIPLLYTRPANHFAQIKFRQLTNDGLNNYAAISPTANSSPIQIFKGYVQSASGITGRSDLSPVAKPPTCLIAVFSSRPTVLFTTYVRGPRGLYGYRPWAKLFRKKLREVYRSTSALGRTISACLCDISTAGRKRA